MPTLKPASILVGILSVVAVGMVALALYVRADATKKNCDAVLELRDAVHAVVILAPGSVVPLTPEQAQVAHKFQNAIEQRLDRVDC